MPSLEELSYEVRWSEAEIVHEGYTDPELIRHKANRDLQLLLLDYLVFPQDPCVLFHLGKAYGRLGNLPQALVYLLRSLNLVTPSARWVARLYGDIIGVMITLGRKKEALSVANQALTYHESNPELLWRHAELLASCGDLRAAEASIQRMLRLPQRDYLSNDLQVEELRVRGRRMLGTLQLQQNGADEAEHIFQQLLSEYPLDVDSWTMLAYVYLQKRHWQKAESVARQLPKLPRGQPLALCIQAEIAKLQANYPAARLSADQAIALAPNLPLPRMIVAEVLELTHADVDDRRHALMEVLRVAPGDAAAQQALAALNRPARARQEVGLFSGIVVASCFQMQD